MRVAVAVGVIAAAIDVRHLFHGFALDATIRPRASRARTNRVRAFRHDRSAHFISYIRGCHFVSPDFGWCLGKLPKSTIPERPSIPSEIRRNRRSLWNGGLGEFLDAHRK